MTITTITMMMTTTTMTMMNEAGMVIREVRSDGWVMEGAMGGRGGSWRHFGRGKQEADLFLQLPPDIACRVKRGVRFSCIALVLRHGVWSPKGMYGKDAMAFANVYPPN